MLSFFKNIRRRILSENKFSKYLFYAFGEIVLIMAGIFMALQLQNWNENRKKDEQFNDMMNKVYTALQDDLSNLKSVLGFIEHSIQATDQLLNPIDTLPKLDKLELFFATYNSDNDYFETDVQFYGDFFSAQFQKEWQSNIAMQILSYLKVSEVVWDQFSFFNYTTKIADVMENNIPFPKINEQKINEGLDFSDPTYYSEAQLNRFDSLLKQEKLQATLKSYRSHVVVKRSVIFSFESEAKSLVKSIENYFPEVQILYQNVGIIGTSLDGFDDVGGYSTPMIETDPDRNIWEITVFLKEGRVKFRCNDSWTLNWGVAFNDVEDYLKSEAIKGGADIPIDEAGNYHVILNLTNLTYSFEKLND